MRSLRIKLLAFAAVAMLATPVFAQTDTYGAKADVALELHPSKLVDSPLGVKMDFKSQLEAVAAKAGPGSPDFSKLDRVFVGLVAPEDMENMEKVKQGAQNDMQFFARLEFSTAEAASQMMAQAMDKNGGVVEKNGKKYYKAPETAKGMPDGTVMFQPDDKSVEVASEGFAYRTDEMPFTDALTTAWKDMPDEALKLSVDGVNARALLKGLAEEGKKNAGNPMAGAVMDLFPTMDNINLSVDLASANLLTMTMVGGDEDKAGEIHDGFKAMMTMVKPLANQGLGMIKQQAPEPAAVFGKVVSDMDVKQEGKVVTLHVPRAEGFEDATVQVVPMLQGLILQMMMGGMGGGPGGPGGPGGAGGAPPSGGDF